MNINDVVSIGFFQEKTPPFKSNHLTSATKKWRGKPLTLNGTGGLNQKRIPASARTVLGFYFLPFSIVLVPLQRRNELTR
jgi:hypothetical protein